MRLHRLSFAVCAAAFAVAGCPKPSVPPTDAGITAAEPEMDAGIADPGLASFTLQYTLPDAGLEAIPLVGEEEGRPLIDPTSMLELRSSLGLRNHRVRLFDEAERAMVSDDTAEESANGLLYRLSLPTPLKAGHKYTLVIDAQTGTSMTDSQGRELPDVRIPFQVSGEKEKPAPPPKKQRRRGAPLGGHSANDRGAPAQCSVLRGGSSGKTSGSSTSADSRNNSASFTARSTSRAASGRPYEWPWTTRNPRSASRKSRPDW
jgi:hypothetical protein